MLCPGRSKTVTEWALRGIDSPVAVARYTTGDIALLLGPTGTEAGTPRPTGFAIELTEKVETAEAIYTRVLDAKLVEDDEAG